MSSRDRERTLAREPASHAGLCRDATRRSTAHADQHAEDEYRRERVRDHEAHQQRRAAINNAPAISVARMPKRSTIMTDDRRPQTEHELVDRHRQADELPRHLQVGGHVGVHHAAAIQRKGG